ncbi:hypothetical protein EC957_011892 [Mortierella hygrophila]|uniref:Uncharacterized protein n=1 Tax=Mortierella hygrophila TaxID=979708 RepID=A0A9P6K3L7_9FUNG|nr:hypothetical protein EC957_011892 [Mortierella hygrophila]
MTTLFAQNPITLRNPFSLLESDFNLEDPFSTATTIPAITASNTTELDLDLSTWSVVNSPSASDDEDSDNDDNDDDEIYHWQISNSDRDSANSPDVDVQALEPLHLSTGKDGFTNISKAKTAHSINSLAASCPEHRGAWVLKVNKKCRNKSQEPQQQQQESAETETETATISTQTHEKRRLSLTSTDSSPSSETQTKYKSTRVETDDLDDTLYMDMTEHELSKSSKASKIKNNRIATSHERELAKDLRCFSEETDKVDKKLLRSHHHSKTVGSRKSNKKAFFDEL